MSSSFTTMSLHTPSVTAAAQRDPPPPGGAPGPAPPLPLPAAPAQQPPGADPTQSGGRYASPPGPEEPGAHSVQGAHHVSVLFVWGVSLRAG